MCGLIKVERERAVCRCFDGRREGWFCVLMFSEREKRGRGMAEKREGRGETGGV